MRTIRWKVARTPTGYAGTIELPDTLGQSIAVTATANSKPAALARSAALASKALENPAVQALLPPGAGPALKTVAKFASSPQAKRLLSKVRSLF